VEGICSYLCQTEVEKKRCTLKKLGVKKLNIAKQKTFVQQTRAKSIIIKHQTTFMNKDQIFIVATLFVTTSAVAKKPTISVS